MITFCIPNFNYGNYMDQTLDSLYNQTNQNFQIVVSDNASTDNSIRIVKKWESKFSSLKYKVNNTNVGFGGNLDRAAQQADGDFMVMLSSDDLVKKHATEVYTNFIKLTQNNYPGETFFFGGQPDMISSEGVFVKSLNKGSNLWFDEDIDKTLTTLLGFNIYRVKSDEMLVRCLNSFKTPLHFITVCYPQKTYKQIEGYGGGRLYNPDKWFNWKLLNATDYVYYLDTPLFDYRWHSNNQANQQQANQILKYWMDEYRNSFEAIELFSANKPELSELIKKSFVRHCILGHVYSNIKSGNRNLAKRIFNFGMSCYPKQMKQDLYFLPLKLITII